MRSVHIQRAILPKWQSRVMYYGPNFEQNKNELKINYL